MKLIIFMAVLWMYLSVDQFHLPPWRRIMVVLCIQLLPSNETATRVDRFSLEDRLWSPTNRIRDGETENTGLK
jgi:hypothetical protein